MLRACTVPILVRVPRVMLLIGRPPIPDVTLLNGAMGEEHCAARCFVGGLVIVEKRRSEARDTLATPAHGLAGNIPHAITESSNKPEGDLHM